MERSKPGTQSSHSNRQFSVGLGRAAAGAIMFSLPLMMTMEMWNLGFSIDPLNRALIILLIIPLLVGLSHVCGFEDTFGWQDDTIDAFVAIAVGCICSGVILALLGVIQSDTPVAEMLGKIELQMIPASIGALLAQSQLGQQSEDQEDRPESYWREIFLMVVGSLYLSLSIAPTEEVLLIAFNVGRWHGLVIGVLSLVLMHAFVYVVDFRGSEKSASEEGGWNLFFRFSVVGYALALLTAGCVLWALGRTTGLDAAEIALITVVLGFPSAVGAAAARLII